MPIKAPVYQPMDYEARYRIATPYIHEALSELQAKQDKARELVAQSSIMPEEYIDPIGRKKYEQFINDQAGKLIETTGGDLARNYQTVLQTIKGIKNSPYLGLNKQQLEEADLQRKLAAQYGPNTIILNDVTKQSLIDSEGNWASPGSIKSNVINAEEFYKTGAMAGKGASEKIFGDWKTTGPGGQLLERMEGFESPEQAAKYMADNRVVEQLYEKYGYKDLSPEMQQVIKTNIAKGFIDNAVGKKVTQRNAAYMSPMDWLDYELKKEALDIKRNKLRGGRGGSSSLTYPSDTNMIPRNGGEQTDVKGVLGINNIEDFFKNYSPGNPEHRLIENKIKKKVGDVPVGNELLSKLPNVDKVPKDKLKEFGNEWKQLVYQDNLNYENVGKLLSKYGIAKEEKITNKTTPTTAALTRTPGIAVTKRYTINGEDLADLKTVDKNNPYTFNELLSLQNKKFQDYKNLTKESLNNLVESGGFKLNLQKPGAKESVQAELKSLYNNKEFTSIRITRDGKELDSDELEKVTLNLLNENKSSVDGKSSEYVLQDVHGDTDYQGKGKITLLGTIGDKPVNIEMVPKDDDTMDKLGLNAYIPQLAVNSTANKIEKTLDDNSFAELSKYGYDDIGNALIVKGKDGYNLVSYVGDQPIDLFELYDAARGIEPTGRMNTYSSVKDALEAVEGFHIATETNRNTKVNKSYRHFATNKQSTPEFIKHIESVTNPNKR